MCEAAAEIRALGHLLRGEPSAGGCILIVAKSLTQSSVDILPQVLAEGRSIMVQLAFPDSELNLVGLRVMEVIPLHPRILKN